MEIVRASVSCRQFVADVVKAADRARKVGGAPARKRRLAAALVRRYVPEVTLLGVDLREFIVAGGAGGRTRPVAPRRVTGFRPELTAGGQDGEALRHLAAAAACKLMRRDFLRRAASVLDRVQGVVRRNPAEARAEVAGNNLGAEMGTLLAQFLEGARRRPTLERRLRELLGGKRRGPEGETARHRRGDADRR